MMKQSISRDFPQESKKNHGFFGFWVNEKKYFLTNQPSFYSVGGEGYGLWLLALLWHAAVTVAVAFIGFGVSFRTSQDIYWSTICRIFGTEPHNLLKIIF